MSSHRSAPTASMGYSNGTSTRRSSGKDAIYNNNNADVAPQSTTTTTSRQSLNGVSIPIPIPIPIPPPTTQHRNYSNKDTETTTTYGNSKFISAVTNSTSSNPRAPIPTVTYTSSGPHLAGSSSNSRSLLQSDGTGSPGSFTVPPPSPPVNRASATPSISSLIDPVPTPTPPPAAPIPTTVHNAPSRASNAKKASNPAPTSAPSARTTTKQRDSAASKPQPSTSDQHVVQDKQTSRVTSTTTAMEIVKESTKSTEGTAPNSSAPSPKPVKEKPEKPAAPVHRGNGLLSGDMFSMKGGDNKAADLSLPTIHLHIPMQGESNKYVNFAKMAEDKYGWAALHPALAKVQENLASMSGDEMAVDGSDSESNPEDRMVVDSGPEKPAAPAKKKRKVQDLYDASDPFIDDSEQMWEEQAAATKDGFFVYSGPLVREGETAQIERADGTIKRPGRGRGRGGGRGGARGGRAPAKPRVPRKKAAEKVIKAQEKTAATAA